MIFYQQCSFMLFENIHIPKAVNPQSGKVIVTDLVSRLLKNCKDNHEASHLQKQ